MAIRLEGASVIAPIRALEGRYPGGEAAYRDDCPNGSYLRDEHLARIGFMSTAEASEFLGLIAAKGLRIADDPEASDALIVVADGAPGEGWLVVGECEGASACWLRESPPGEMVRWRQGPIYRCPGPTVGEIPGIFRAAGFACRPDGGDSGRLICGRDGHRIDVDIIGGEAPGADGCVILAGERGRIAGAPDDEALLREVDALLRGRGLVGLSAG